MLAMACLVYEVNLCWFGGSFCFCFCLYNCVEVMKGLKARKQAAIDKGPQEEASEKPERLKHKKHVVEEEARMPLLDKENQVNPLGPVWFLA